MPYWPNGKIYLDKSKSMYKTFGGGKTRKLSIWQLFSLSSIMGAYKQTIAAVRSGQVSGNLSVGNGFHLGGVLVVGNKQQGLIYEWKQQYETLANTQEILEAAKQIQAKL